ncbi:lytic transglycosylase domain-containing protein [Sphingomonas sp. PB4P5]|uniref:lytic transglycosylase domain-containing protein n=1 Tax=Parasphingomonas puruogangriensis TaxID=3096155 RepID=UPI002FC64B1C
MLSAIGRRRCRLIAALACCCGPASSAQTRPAGAPCNASSSLDEPIAQAARRFAIPDALIRAVITVESRGAVFAVSPKGAMGLMQLMPGTWGELRLRHALGIDPFDPCDNILAGTAYLRELLDRYGDPGFLAAYNAGPRRYESYLGGRALPRETIAYVARLSGQMVGGSSAPSASALLDAEVWRRGDLFARAPRLATGTADQQGGPASGGSAANADTRQSVLSRDSVFVPRTSVPE